MAKLGQALIQSQQQVLKPQQILVSTLLQLPMLMLEQKITTELELNPVLELAEDWEDGQDSDEDNEMDENKEEQKEIEDEFKELEENNKSDEDKLNDEVQEEVNLEEMLPNEDDMPDPRMPKDNQHEDLDLPEPYVESMSEHLLTQLQMLNLSELEYRIGEYLVYNIREDGYLDSEVTCESVSQIFEVPEDLVEKILRRIQRFDPVGIASRDMRECLLAQLHARRTEDHALIIPIRILQDCYDDFVNRRFEKVADALSITLDEVKQALEEIARLNPKPGEGYSESKLHYIVPDFYVSKVDDDLVITLNEYKTPGLRISNAYKKMIRHSRGLDKDTRKFLKEKVDSAKWFIKAIQQRQVTMQRTMEAIVERQEDFFEHGPDFIKPMIMKDIAEEINMDISTVSRVCKGKYVETDHGIFALKYFFNEGMETEDGEDMSTLRIKERLKELIDKENTRKPLSDEKLAQMLNTEGIPVARRTVAKYREQLDIPVARLRRSI